MTFLAPIAGLLAGATGLGLVLLMYMLRLRRRPVLVSSTMLWQRAVRDIEGNIPWKRLSPSLLLLLHLLIVALLALALARPVMDTGLGEGQRAVLVIDTSASMRGRLDGVSLIDRAKEQARTRVRALFDSGRSPRVSVIEAGLEPRIVLRDSGERGRVLATIDSLVASDQPGSLGEALAVIERLGAGRGGDEAVGSGAALVWVYSDGAGLGGGPVALSGASGVLVGSAPEGAALRNLGIVSLSAQRDRVDAELCRVFVRVMRSEQGPGAGVLRVLEGDELIRAAPVSFGSDQRSVTHSFELRLLRGALLRVELAGEDALDSDQRAWVSVPAPDPVRVTIVAPGGVVDPLLLDSVEVVARAPARVVAPGEPLGDPGLIVYDRVDTPELPPVPSVGFGSVTPSFSARPGEPGSVRRVLSWDRGDPLLRDAGIGAMGFVPSVSFDEAAPGLRVLARDAGGAALVEIGERGLRHVRASFALHDSDWSVQVGFTIFMAQVLEQLLPGTGGQGTVQRTDTPIVYRDESGVERAMGPIARIGPARVPDGREVGVSLLVDAETGMETRNGVRFGDAADGSGGARFGRARVDLWRWFVLGAIGLLLLEWLLYLRRVRVSVSLERRSSK